MDILAIGEMLIDLTQSGVTEQGIPRFDANPGGAPANLAVAAARLGAKTALIAKVGDDRYGALLKDCLARNGVDGSGIVTDRERPTTLAVVSLDERGERHFSFYRDHSADVALTEADVSPALLADARILHFGSVSLTADPARSATLSAVRRAKARGALISYDPNYRARLWPNAQEAVRQMRAPLPLADILKVSDEEVPLLTGTDDPEAGAAWLAEQGIPLVFVTLGARGAYYRFKGRTGYAPGVPCQVADTNGAGDTFFGAVLSRLARYPDWTALTMVELAGITAFANTAASLTASRHGAIPAMPSLEEVKALL